MVDLSVQRTIHMLGAGSREQSSEWSLAPGDWCAQSDTFLFSEEELNFPNP